MKMKFEVEVNNLGDTFKALMFQRNKTYRDVGAETGVSYCTVWRFATKPFAISADSFIALWRWMAINEDELVSFWQKETNRQIERTVYPDFHLTIDD